MRLKARLAAARKHPPRQVRERGYVEAYPVAEVAAFRRAARRGFNLCVWVDNRKRAACVANFSWDEGEGLFLRYRHGGDDGEFTSGSLMLESAGAASQGSAKRALLLCPGCGRARAALVLRKGIWKCRQCHGLIYRSTKIGSPVRYAERYAALALELDRLIAKGRRSDLIEGKRGEVEEAFKRAGPLPHAIPNSNYAYKLVTGWATGAFTSVPLFCDPDGHRVRIEDIDLPSDRM